MKKPEKRIRRTKPKEVCPHDPKKKGVWHRTSRNQMDGGLFCFRCNEVVAPCL